MKKLLIVGTFGLGFLGCSLFQAVGTGEPVKDMAVSVASSEDFSRALLSAANRRRWMVVPEGDDTYHLSIHQCSNVCEVRVVYADGKFSILPVKSNIPVRKYDQWVNNLYREIVHRACMPGDRN